MKDCWIHDWTKWESYKWEGTEILGRLAPAAIQGKQVEVSEMRQKRSCTKCGKMQDELVRVG